MPLISIPTARVFKPLLQPVRDKVSGVVEARGRVTSLRSCRND
jgi:hypothetical protein